jgi:hypothetical protein
MYKVQNCALFTFGLLFFIAGPFMVGIGTDFSLDHLLTIYVAMYWAVGLFAMANEAWTLLSSTEYSKGIFPVLKIQEGELFFAGFILLLGALGFMWGMVAEFFNRNPVHIDKRH